MSFTPRFTAPSVSDLKWKNTSYGGYNRCIVIDTSTGSVLPNCTGYAWGRALEILNLTDCNLSTRNADNWYNNTADGYPRGSVAKLGAILCYSGGYLTGHVAVVEQINQDGSIIISESNYGGDYFRTVTLPSNYSYNNLVFQGFIYIIDEPIPPTPSLNNYNEKFPWVLYARKLRKLTKTNKK